MLSFAVRELGAIAGIVITASHNPPQYNGYKVYWEDGGQVPPERAEKIRAAMQAVGDIRDPADGGGRGPVRGLLLPVPQEVDEAYYRRLLDLVAEGRAERQACASCSRRCTGRGLGRCGPCWSGPASGGGGGGAGGAGSRLLHRGAARPGGAAG